MYEIRFSEQEIIYLSKLILKQRKRTKYVANFILSTIEHKLDLAKRIIKYESR